MRYLIAGAVQPKLREMDAIDSPLSYRATIVGRSERGILPRVVAPFIVSIVTLFCRVGCIAYFASLKTEWLALTKSDNEL